MSVKRQLSGKAPAQLLAMTQSFQEIGIKTAHKEQGGKCLVRGWGHGSLLVHNGMLEKALRAFLSTGEQQKLGALHVVA